MCILSSSSLEAGGLTYSRAGPVSGSSYYTGNSPFCKPEFFSLWVGSLKKRITLLEIHRH